MAACAIVKLAVNQCLVLTAIKASDRSDKLREVQFRDPDAHNDVTEICVAVLATLAWR